MMCFPRFEIAARLNHLEPAQVLYGFVRALDGLVHCVLNGFGGSAGFPNVTFDTPPGV